MGKRAELMRLYWRRLKVEGIATSLMRLVRHPSRVVGHGVRLARADTTGRSNRYGRSASLAADVRLVAGALRLDEATAEQAIAEIGDDALLVSELTGRYQRSRPEWQDTFDLGRFKVIYALVRLSRPETVLETGVHDGLSSAVILRALERNGSGALVSIDLPSTDLPIGVDGPGWLVPERLKDRWTLCLGDSRKLLPELAAARGPIDIFLHDSDHSRTHREFEFRTVRESMRPGGLIASDDDDPSDTLLDELGREWHMEHLTNATEGFDGPSLGVLRP